MYKNTSNNSNDASFFPRHQLNSPTGHDFINLVFPGQWALHSSTATKTSQLISMSHRLNISYSK